MCWLPLLLLIPCAAGLAPPLGVSTVHLAGGEAFAGGLACRCSCTAYLNTCHSLLHVGCLGAVAGA